MPRFTWGRSWSQSDINITTSLKLQLQPLYICRVCGAALSHINQQCLFFTKQFGSSNKTNVIRYQSITWPQHHLITFLSWCATITWEGFRINMPPRLTFLYIRSPNIPVFKIQFFPPTPTDLAWKNSSIQYMRQHSSGRLWLTHTQCPLLSNSTAWPRLLPQRCFAAHCVFSSFIFLLFRRLVAVVKFHTLDVNLESQLSRKERQQIMLAAVKHSLPDRNVVAHSISSGRVATAAFNCSRLSDSYTEPRECSIWVTSFGRQSNWRYSQTCET